MNPLDFSVLKAAGLTQAEFAELCEVTRTTANIWISGRSQPHRFIRKRIAAVLAAITDAVNAETLPLSTDSDTRTAMIRAALRNARAAAPTAASAATAA